MGTEYSTEDKKVKQAYTQSFPLQSPLPRYSSDYLWKEDYERKDK